MSVEDDFLDVENSFARELREEIFSAIIHHERHRPRSLQTHLGPSEAGSPCARRLAYSVTGTKSKGGNIYSEVMPSMIGTSMHSTMEKVMGLQNEILGRERWHSEIRVKEPIEGTCDLYDEDTHTVVDWKFLGKSTHDKYSKHGPSVEYHEQVHLYGLGIQNLGYKVENVSIMMFNRNGRLRDAHLWMEPFDAARAQRIADRLFAIEQITKDMEMDKYPYRINLIPATPGDSCFFCPFFNPLADGTNPWECVGTGGNPNRLIESGEI